MDGRPDASAARKAGAKSSVFSTVTPKPPKLRAMAAKSGFFSVGGGDAAGILFLVHADGAYMALSSTTAMMGASYWMAVANSWPFIRKSPSPFMASTVRCG